VTTGIDELLLQDRTIQEGFTALYADLGENMFGLQPDQVEF